MGARKNRGTKHAEWDETVRERIKTSMITNRLIDHVLSAEDVLSASQVAAAKILLAKVMPDLSAVDSTVSSDNVTRIIADKPMTVEQWAKEYGAEMPHKGNGKAH